MRNHIKEIVNNSVYTASVHLLTHKIPIGMDINYFVDDIFRSSLQQLAQHFINAGKLRNSEQHALDTLTSDCNTGKTLTNIKQHLIQNLNNIKPKWSELFGTNRGNVFHAFRYLLQWPCFSDAFRSQINTEKVEALKESMHLQTLELTDKTSQLEQAGESLKRNDAITQKTAQRTASQFIEIQKLTMENKTLSSKLEAAEKRAAATNPSTRTKKVDIAPSHHAQLCVF